MSLILHANFSKLTRPLRIKKPVKARDKLDVGENIPKLMCRQKIGCI